MCIIISSKSPGTSPRITHTYDLYTLNNSTLTPRAILTPELACCFEFDLHMTNQIFEVGMNSVHIKMNKAYTKFSEDLA